MSHCSVGGESFGSLGVVSEVSRSGPGFFVVLFFLCFYFFVFFFLLHQLGVCDGDAVRACCRKDTQ